MSASRRRSGFTLLEMVIVVGILAAIAATAMLSVSQLDDQSRFDDTKVRAQHLRDAIVGPSGTLNGSPILQGFVADMGRLPLSLDELVSLPTNATSYVPNLKLPAPNDTWDLSVGGGWRGPYIAAEPDPATPWFAAGCVRDGWGNRVATETATSPDPNFGWGFNPPTLLDPIAGVAPFALKSFGSDGQNDVLTPPTEWRATDVTSDFRSDDFLVSIPASLKVDTVLTLASTQTLSLRIFYPARDVSGAVILRSVESDTFSLGPGPAITQTFTFNTAGVDVRVPMGVRSIVVWDVTNARPSGDPTTQRGVPISFVPRTALPVMSGPFSRPIPWIGS